jgi:RecA/RadA recombinase
MAFEPKGHMVTPFDLSKLRKGIDKSIKGLSVGFHDPKTWLSTGCYALNYLISDNFRGGFPLEGKFCMVAGDSGSGKSYITSANVIKDAQSKGVYCVLIDTENALDESWLNDLDVNTDISVMEKITAAKVDDVAKLIAMIVDMYKAQNDPLSYKDRPKLLIIIDSLGMTITENMEIQFDAGDQKGDLGIKAKQITALLRVTMAKIAAQPIGLLATNHVYTSQSKYDPDKIAGGNMVEFASSVIVQMNKFLLKEDENGKDFDKGSPAAGIKSTAVVRKSRYAKPFEKVYIQIPYTTGMNPYSGLFDLFIGKGLLIKSGNSYEYTSRKTGEVFKEMRKNLKAKGVYDTIMEEQPLWDVEPPREGFDNSDSADFVDNEEE